MYDSTYSIDLPPIISLISISSYLIFPKLNFALNDLSFMNFIIPYLCLGFFVSFFNIFCLKTDFQLILNKIHLFIQLLVLIIFSYLIYQKNYLP